MLGVLSNGGSTHDLPLTEQQRALQSRFSLAKDVAALLCDCVHTTVVTAFTAKSTERVYLVSMMI